MSHREDSPQGEGPNVSERLKAERIQESLKAERIQEALVDGGDSVFREAFLVHAPPDGARTLRQFGRYMYETLLESGLRESPSPSLGARLRAVAEDLRFSAQVLAGLGAARGEAALAPEDMSLSLKAESWAREVSELVRAMEGAAPGTGEE